MDWDVDNFLVLQRYHVTLWLVRSFGREKLDMKAPVMDDDRFRAKAERAFLSEREAAAILRIRTLNRFWREGDFDQDATSLDKLAMSHAVANYKRENTKRRNKILNLILDSLAKFRF